MNKLYDFIMVGLGGAAGSMMRYGITLLFAALGWSNNMATMAVNLTDSFAIGFLSVRLFQDGKFLPLIFYVAGTVVLCVMLAFSGNLLGKKLPLV